MNFSRLDRQRSGTIEDAHLSRKIVMGAQIAVELRAVGLLDHQHPALALERGRKLFRLHRPEQARGGQRDLDPVRLGAGDCLARGAG